MSVSVYNSSGVVLERWDDTTRTYTKWNASGAVITTRPYTTEENSRADAEALIISLDNNRMSIETALADGLITLQAIIDQTNADLRADPSQEIKDLARTLRRVIRLIIRRFDGTA